MPNPKKLLDALYGSAKAAKAAPKPAVSRLDMNFKDVTKRMPELQQAAKLYEQGKITREQYYAIVDQLKPVTPYEFIPKPATAEEALSALTSDKVKDFGRTDVLTPGETILSRLDIPAYSKKGTWVTSQHRLKPPPDEPKTIYTPTMMLEGETKMMPGTGAARRVAKGEKQKSSFATIRGAYKPGSDEEAVERAIEALRSKDYAQIGYDPERRGFFYDRRTMEPIIGTEEGIIQIGPLVLGKKPVRGKPEDFEYASGGAVGLQSGGTPLDQVKDDLTILPEEDAYNLWKGLDRIYTPKIGEYIADVQSPAELLGRIKDLDPEYVDALTSGLSELISQTQPMGPNSFDSVPKYHGSDPLDKLNRQEIDEAAWQVYENPALASTFVNVLQNPLAYTMTESAVDQPRDIKAEIWNEEFPKWKEDLLGAPADIQPLTKSPEDEELGSIYQGLTPLLQTKLYDKGQQEYRTGGAVHMQDGGSPLDQFYQPANPMARRAAEQERMRQEIARRRAEELARQQTPLDASLPGPSPTRPGLPSMADLKGAFERRVMPVISEAKQTAMTGGILGDLARAYGEASVPVNQAMATALGRPFEQERPPAAPPEMTVPTAFERRGDIFQQLAGQAIGDPANLLDPGILRGLEAGARAVKPSVMRGLEAGTQAARPYAQTLAEMVEEMAMKGVPGTDAMQLRMGILPETPKLPEAPASTAEAQPFTGRIKDDAQLIAVRGQAPASVERAETALNSGQRVFKFDENGNQVQVMDPAELVDVQPESLRIVNISPQELEAVNLAAKRNPEAQRSMLDQIEGLHRDFAPEDGWAPLNIVEAEVKVDKRGKPIINRQTGLPMTEVKPAKTPYAFHIPPEGMPKEAWEEVLAARLTDEVDQVLQRAKAGDQDAISILQEAAWYRAMRNRLRSEFGGIGDVFADVLGTTSAQTGVEQNFDNAIEILRRFARGDYDRELLAYDKRVRAGETVDGKVLTRMFRDNEFPLITKAGGQLFNANSPASMGALLDMFRAIKAGDAPKTPNFTGNLIGLTNEATIDVWAARMLRRLADLPRIAPPAEKGVAGLHKVGSTLYQPDVSGEFGFGQDVFRKAAQELNNAGMLKAYDPVIGDLGPDDLQAIAWFIEKELWTKNKWTSKAGEGGSLDYEMSFAGTPDSERVKSLRKDINKQFSPAKYPQRKVEGDEDYAKRLETERIAFETNKADKAEQLKNLKADVNRYRLGVSGERPNKPMSDYGQAELASEFDDVVRDDPSVVTYNLTSTLGSFMGDTERALNAEFITRSDFNPLPLERRLVEQGKYYDQDAVFMSKAVPIDAPNARPGVEIYFKQKLSPADMALVTEKLRSYGVDGFTYISDMRMENRPNLRVTTQAMQNKTFRPFAEDLRPEPGSSGITFQYIPEFDDEFDAANAAAIMQQRREIYMQIIEDMANSGNVSDARLTHFDTKVFFRGDYDDYLARATGDSYQAPRREQQSGSISEESNTRGKNQQKLQRAVSDRVREEASSQAVKKPGGKKPLAKAAGGRVHVSNNLDTMLLELMRNKRYG